MIIFGAMSLIYNPAVSLYLYYHTINTLTRGSILNGFVYDSFCFLFVSPSNEYHFPRTFVIGKPYFGYVLDI
jgi:hypothetical protein